MADLQKNQILSKLNKTTYKTRVSEKSLDIEVGDEKQADFKPRVKIKKWDNEVNFSVGVIEELPTYVCENIDNKIIWKQGNKEARFYPIEDGFEFELVLAEKPVSNVVNFSIKTKELDFFYQPFLTEEEKLSRKDNRPDNVEGSYAVYHKSKKNNKYETGKAFHIYRPKIIDSNGKWAWGKINIDIENEILSIEIPQSILDNGVYPLTVDPTFGYASSGGSSLLEAGDTIMWTRFTGAVGQGVSMVASLIGTDFSNETGKMAIYKQSDNSLLLNSSTVGWISLTTGTNWKTDSFVTAPYFTATDYLLAVWVSGNDKNITKVRYDAGTANYGGQDSGQYYTGTFPVSVTWDTTNNYKYSIYVNYDELPKTIVQSSDLPTVTYNFEEGSIPVAFTTSKWEITSVYKHAGNYSTRSGAVGPSDTGYMQLVAPFSGTVTYWRYGQSEVDYDFFKFKVNGVVKEAISGDKRSWVQSGPYAFESGQILRWEYVKDEAYATGWDKWYIDDIVLTQNGPISITGINTITF